MKTDALSIAAAALIAGAANAAPANQERPTDLTSPPPPPMAAGADAYMKLIGVDGETKAVPLQSLQWSAMPRAGCSGALGPGSMVIGGDVPAGATGAHIKKATLFVRKAPGRGTEMTVEMEDILVSSVTSAAHGSAAGASPGKLARVEYRGASWSVAGCRG